jgi:hypothetical protein
MIRASATQVVAVGAQQGEIHRAVLDSGLDLGLVDYLGGDDLPPGFAYSTDAARWAS